MAEGAWSVASLPADLAHMRRDSWCGEMPEQLEGWQGDPSMVLIHGEPGSGKTHLAVSVLKRWPAAEPGGTRPLGSPPWHHRLPRLFLLPLLIHGMRQKVASGGGDAELLMLRSECAVFDDLGAESSTDWATEIVTVALMQRHLRRRPTIVTSNLSPDQLHAQQPRIGSRLLSGLIIRCDGDRRLRGIDERSLTAGGAA